MNQKTMLILLIAFLCSNCFIFGQKKIERSKEELTEQSGVNYQSTTTTTYSTSRSSSSSSNSFGESLLVEIAAYLFVYTTYGVVKYGIVGDYYNENHLYSNLSHYPYKNGNYGNYNSNNSLSKCKVRLDVENTFMYNSNDLLGNHLKLKIRPFQYFYLQTDFRQLFEFDRINDANYQLNFSHFTLGYDRVRLNKFNLGWNLGISYIGNDVRKAGFTYGINSDFFLDKNISFSGSAKWSKINTRPVNAFELQSKYHIKNYYFTLGYEHLKIGTPTYNFVTLGAGIYF